MTQQREPGSELQDESPAAPASERRARRISVIESINQGIKVRDGDAFDPHRFQEFDFTPAFRDKIMRASLPLLDLRQLLEDQPGHDNWRHAGPNDITRPANNNPASKNTKLARTSVAPISGNVAQPPTCEPQTSNALLAAVDASAESTPRVPSDAMRRLVAGRKLRKASNTRRDGKHAKKWKLLLFGGSLVMAMILSLAQSQGPALASTTSVGRFALKRANKQQLQRVAPAVVPQPGTAVTHLTEQTSKPNKQSKEPRTNKGTSKSAPKTLWLPAE